MSCTPSKGGRKKKVIKFTTIGILITVLGQPFKEELFERVLHEHLTWRKCAMAVTEYDGDKVHYHLVALCTRPNMWHSSNLREQLGRHCNMEPLRSPEDVVTAMAYLSKFQTPSVWAVTSEVARHYKLAVLDRIIQKAIDAHNSLAREHYDRQYRRVRLAFFPIVEATNSQAE